MTPTTCARILLCCATGAFTATAAHADVRMEERMTLGGSGMMKMVNMSGTTTTTISGDRARTDSNLQFESGLMRTFARGMGQATEIVRMDEDKIYSVNPEKKTYTEISFADRRAQMQQAMEQMRKSQGAQQQSTSGVDTSQCEWSEPKTEVQRTGEKVLIAGYQAERATIISTQSCKDKKTGQVCDFGIVLDQWVAPGFEAANEALAYQKAYAEKLGFGAASSRDFAERAESFFGSYKGMWAEIAKHTRDMKGYAVKTSFGLGVGGPQCQSTQQAQASGGPAEPPSIGGALGGALGGVFGRKKEQQPQPQAAATPPATMPGGLMPLMTLSNELLSVNRGAVDPASFEPPAGFKKVDK
jgi:hypothetical protein